MSIFGMTATTTTTICYYLDLLLGLSVFHQTKFDLVETLTFLKVLMRHCSFPVSKEADSLSFLQEFLRKAFSC